MGFTTMEIKRPILLTGKAGTGKTTKAKEWLPDAALYYANEMNIRELGSMSIENGIIIEDIHIKPKKDEILNVLRKYRGQVIITSINEKSVPKDIKSMCQIKRAGSTKHLLNAIQEIAPRSCEPLSMEQDTYSLVSMYLKETIEI
jgi:transcriptional regulator with AAA-type ATPase domain